MKKISYIITFCLILLINQSCRDSLGIDPAVQITPAGNPGGGIGDSSPNMFRADTLIFKEITEKYFVANAPMPDIWANYNLSANLNVDTTNKSKCKIWLDIALSSPNNAQSGSIKRKDWIANLKIKFKTIISLNELYALNGQPGNWNSINLNVDSVTGNTIKNMNYNGSQIDANISFTGVDLISGMISGMIFVDITRAGKLETISMSGIFNIILKK